MKDVMLEDEDLYRGGGALNQILRN